MTEIEIAAATCRRHLATIDPETGGNADHSPEGWIHFHNANTRDAFLRDRAEGHPAMPHETAEVEARFWELLDEGGWQIEVVEGPRRLDWHFSAFNAEKVELSSFQWDETLEQARRDCGFGFPAYRMPTAPENADA